MLCRYCDNTGLSRMSGAGYTLSICNVCDAGVNLQKVLILFAQAEAKQPAKVAELIEAFKRVVEI